MSFLRPASWTVAAALLIGCAATERPKVFVDLGKLSASQLPGDPGWGPMAASQSGSSLSLPGSSSARIFVGLTEEEVLRSIGEVKTNQESAVARILDQRIRVLDAEVEAALAAARVALTPKHSALLDDALSRTRVPFDRVAPDIFKLTLEFANLAGFPDKGQEIEVVDAPWSRARAKRLEEIRAELSELNAKYLRERNAILKEINDIINSDFEGLDRNAKEARRERQIELEARLRDLIAENNPVDFNIGRIRSAASLPASATVSKATDSVSEQLPGAPRIPAKPEPTWVATQKARIWAATMGYDLVENPNEGRDATMECIKWIQEQPDGR